MTKFYHHQKLNCKYASYVSQITRLRSAVGNMSADPGVASLIPAWSHTFIEIDHEIISTAILLPSFHPLIQSRRVVVSYKLKYVNEVLVNCLFKLAQEKVWLGELTVPHDHRC